jgi:hypothetical protein
MKPRYSRALSRSTPAPATSPRTTSLSQARRELRRCGSALIDVAPYLSGHDFEVAVRMSDASEWLLGRLAAAERRAA